MVVLESKSMLTAGSNQYLQPDYLTPIASTLDSKKSPLALLAQTCSQIGADSSKPIPSSDKKKEEDKKEKTPSPVEPRRSPAFKPYESATKKSDESSDEKPSGRSSGQGSQRPSSVSSNGGGSSTSVREVDGRKSIETSSSASTTPIIRSGLEVLAGHPKDVPLGTYRPGLPSFLPGYPGLESHPAFRGAHPGLLTPGLLPGLPASLSSSYPAAAAALYSSAGLTGSLPPSLFTGSAMVYTRVKLSGGGDAVIPVCRDPYCSSCPYSPQNNHLLQSGGTCPPSCSQCEQAKAALSGVPGLSSLPSSSLVPASSLLPTTSVGSLYSPSSPSLLAAAAAAPRPYVCSWVSGESYCGKRFGTSDELLQHLRTHTSATSADSATLSLLSNPLHAHAALLSSAHSALHRPGVPYPPPALSPLTAARYHPYGKPPLTTSSALTPSLPVLSPYAPLAASYPPGFSPYAGLYPRPPL